MNTKPGNDGANSRVEFELKLQNSGTSAAEVSSGDIPAADTNV